MSKPHSLPPLVLIILLTPVVASALGLFPLTSLHHLSFTLLSIIIASLPFPTVLLPHFFISVSVTQI